MLYLNERKMIIDACESLLSEGYFSGTYGNISIRIKDSVLFTPSGVDYLSLTPKDILLTDYEGNIIEGELSVTSEKDLHLKIYRERSDVGSVIHTHSENALLVSATDTTVIPCISEEMAQVIGGPISLTESYVRGEYHKKLAEYAVSALGDRNAALIRNHGTVSCGRTLNEALLSGIIAEKSCRMYLNALSAGLKIHPIPDECIQKEHHRYLYSYGKQPMR